jgi:hypothetical protein
MAVEARAHCGDCDNNNNNNKVIIIKIKTDENLTLTKRLIKKYISYLHSIKQYRSSHSLLKM